MMHAILEQVGMRFAMLFGRGRITAPVDDSGTVQMMQVEMSGLEISDERYRVAEFGFTSNPPIGSDVIAGHVAGDRSAAVVIGTNHQPSRPTGLQSGETMLYSQDGKSVYLTSSGGIVVNAKNQAVTVNGATIVTINAATEVDINTPILRVSGDIVDNAGTNTTTMAHMRSQYNTHTHTDPQGGVTGTPNNLM